MEPFLPLNERKSIHLYFDSFGVMLFIILVTLNISPLNIAIVSQLAELIEVITPSFAS